MVHAFVVVRRRGRGMMTRGMSAMVHGGCAGRPLQARAGLPRRAATDQRNGDGADQYVAKDPTHRRMLAEAKAKRQRTED